MPQRMPWMLMIPVLLLASLLAVLQLNTHAFAVDEVASMYVARGPDYQPFNFFEVWEQVAIRSSDQALGLALILSQWGTIFGWSELPMRALAYFAGLVALAMIYRLGTDLFRPIVGLVAALLLASSLFYISYMHIIRVFTLVALTVVLTVWSYWRVIFCARPARFGVYVALFAGSVGLFYTHYFATPLIIALGLYHVLFVSKDRRWWRVIGTITLAGILFLPELNVFLSGVLRNLDKENLHERAMSTPQVLAHFIHFFTNGMLTINEKLILPLGVVVAISPLLYRHKIAWRANRNLLYLAFITLVLFGLILTANAWLQVMTPQRIRYTTAVWPLIMLLLSCAIWYFGRTRARLTGVVIGVWVVVSVWVNLATDLRYDLDAFTRAPLHLVHQELVEAGTVDDTLLVNGFWMADGRPRDFYTVYDVPIPREIIYQNDADSVNNLTGLIHEPLRVWLLAEGRTSENYDQIETLLDDNLVYCRTSADVDRLILRLYAQAEVFCDAEGQLVDFGDDADITLAGYDDSLLDADHLQVDMTWEIDPDVPPETYSVGLYVLDTTDHVVAQSDSGLPDTELGLTRQSVDISDVPPGDYQLMVSVYNWKTVTPLPAVDLDTGVHDTVILLDTFSVSAS